MGEHNLRVLMRRHPRGMVCLDDFTLERAEIPSPGAGEALVAVSYLSLDPYMRTRMDPLRSYVPALTPGEVMPGSTVGEVVESNDPQLPKGTIVAGTSGWQEYGLVTREAVRVIDPDAGSVTAALSVLGMTSVTAPDYAHRPRAWLLPLCTRDYCVGIPQRSHGA